MALQESATGQPDYDYDLPGWETTDEGFIFFIRIRSAWLYVHVLAENFHRSPLALEIMQTNLAGLNSGEDTSDDFWDYLEDTASHFLPAFRQLSPVITHVGKLTLADLQVRQRYKCELKYYDEIPHPSAIISYDSEQENDFDNWDDPEPVPLESPFPCFRSSDVEVDFDDPHTVFNIIPEKVTVQGMVCFWKPSIVMEGPKEVIKKYSKIYKSGLSSAQLPTSRLYGIVVHKNGTVDGMLYHWIDVDRGITWKTVEEASENVRAKWASQIQQTISTLHAMGVTWGDVKAANVVIDKSGNAVVIDLEGGTTDGWVDKDKSGTVEGDLQGLQRLMDYILKDDSALRLREKQWDQDEDACCH